MRTLKKLTTLFIRSSGLIRSNELICWTLFFFFVLLGSSADNCFTTDLNPFASLSNLTVDNLNQKKRIEQVVVINVEKSTESAL